MKKILAFNIETAADEDKRALVPEPELKFGNIKDPAKIQKKKDDARAKQLAKLALDPFFGRIISVGFAHIKDGDVKCGVFTLGGKFNDEKSLIEHAWSILDRADQIVTFNGYGFDMPYMRTRSQLCGLPGVSKFNVRSKYATEHVTDTVHTDLMLAMQNICGNQNPTGVKRGLAFYAQQFLGKSFPYDEVDQSTFCDIVNENPTIVTEINDWNCRSTIELFRVASKICGE